MDISSCAHLRRHIRGCPHTYAHIHTHSHNHTHTPEKSSPIDKKGHGVHSYVIYWKRRLLTSSGLFLWQKRRTGSNLNIYPPPHTQTQTHSHTHLLTTPTKKQVFYSVDPIKGSFPEGAGTIKIKRESAKRTEQQQSDCSLLTSVSWKLMTMWGFYRFIYSTEVSVWRWHLFSLCSCWHQLSPNFGFGSVWMVEAWLFCL